MSNTFIPVSEPLLDGNEKKYLLECVHSGWISSEGPFVRRLEEAWAKRVGRKYGICVSNGSVALDLAMTALDLSPGDEVILPTFTIISCAAAIVRAGAAPVVVDCDPTTWNMDVNQVAEKITLRTRAIMVVHIYGLPVDMAPILDLANHHGLKIIEDAAEAHGQTYRGQPCGSFGDISTFSFYTNKLITTGEGGMVLTNDPALADRLRSMRNLCFQKKEKRYVHEELGWNFRMSNVQAALGVAQLERLEEFVVKKREFGRRYTELLRNVVDLELPVASTPYADNIYWVYGVVLKDHVPFGSDQIMARLACLGVETRPFFWPMHEQPVLRKLRFFDNISCPVAERIARRGFYIPCGLGVNEGTVQEVVTRIRTLLR